MKYQVRKASGGKRIVSFQCPACSSEIESPLEDAGQAFDCPSCAHKFVTPGLPEMQQWRNEQIEAEAKRTEEQRAREARAAEMNRVKAETAAQQRAAAAKAAAEPPSYSDITDGAKLLRFLAASSTPSPSSLCLGASCWPG